MTNPFPIPHKKEWADLGPYRAQVNAATRAQEAAMAKKGRKGGKPKLFARSTDLSRDRRAQKRAAGKRSSRIGLREPELRSVLSGAGDEEGAAGQMEMGRGTAPAAKKEKTSRKKKSGVGNNHVVDVVAGPGVTSCSSSVPGDNPFLDPNRELAELAVGGDNPFVASRV